MLVNGQTLSVALQDKRFGKTFDMNGTLVLENVGIVYSKLIGTDGSGGADFGNFKTLPEKEKLGFSGVSEIPKELQYVFPLPLKIDGNLVVGEFYQIELNDGWVVEKVNEKGDLSIVTNN